MKLKIALTMHIIHIDKYNFLSSQMFFRCAALSVGHSKTLFILVSSVWGEQADPPQVVSTRRVNATPDSETLSNLIPNMLPTYSLSPPRSFLLMLSPLYLCPPHLLSHTHFSGLLQSRLPSPIIYTWKPRCGHPRTLALIVSEHSNRL